MKLKAVAKTTLDILNQNCQGEQILKGGNRIDEQWVPLDIAQSALDKTLVAYKVARAERDELFNKIEAFRKWIEEEKDKEEIWSSWFVKTKFIEIFGE